MAEAILSREHPVVSFESDELILVDEQDREIGFRSKAQCHDGQGALHRAFSLFIFNPTGELLLQQRSAAKRLWPLYWSNSCCSHPRRGESMELAIERRLREELALSCDLKFLYKFIYHAQFGELGAEHELCWVYAGRTAAELKPNHNEIAAWRYVSPADLDREMVERPERFTPWFKLEWERLQRDHGEQLASL